MVEVSKSIFVGHPAILLVGGVLFALLGGSFVASDLQTNKYASVPGIVTYVGTNSSYRNHTEDFYSVVVYAYEVGGRTYKASGLAPEHLFIHAGLGGMASAVAQSRRYHVDEQVKVFYDPNHPEHALLRPGVTLESGLLLLSGVAAAVAGFLRLPMQQRSRKRRIGKASAVESA
jgi:hypothetical protein